jgi:hypothetical protein
VPYIPPTKRSKYNPLLEELIAELQINGIESDGDVNYCIARIISGVYAEGGYWVFNRAMGVLESVKQEFYRRRLAPHEDKKCKENGDVF